MNEINFPDRTSNVPWPTSDNRMCLPDPSPDSDKAASEALGLLDNTVQGAHDTIDRIAEGAAPAVQKLGESVSAAEHAMHTNAAQLRETRDEWVEGARCTVRSKPLASVAAAFVLGLLYARITR